MEKVEYVDISWDTGESLGCSETDSGHHCSCFDYREPCCYCEASPPDELHQVYCDVCGLWYDEEDLCKYH